MSWDNDQNQQRKRANDRYRKALDNGKLDVFGMRLWEPTPEVVDTPPKRRRDPKRVVKLSPRQAGKTLSEVFSQEEKAWNAASTMVGAMNSGPAGEAFKKLYMGTWEPDDLGNTGSIEIPSPIVELDNKKPKEIELTSSELRKNRAINLD